MAKGRKTGGRTKGTPNKVTQKQREAAVQSGLTPLEYMLSVMRNEALDMDIRMDAAHKAAPYVHAKLASVDHTGNVGFHVVLESDATKL